MWLLLPSTVNFPCDCVAQAILKFKTFLTLTAYIVQLNKKVINGIALRGHKELNLLFTWLTPVKVNPQEDETNIVTSV